MQLNVRTRYSKSDEFEYQTILERLDLDLTRKHDVISGSGFIISSSKAIKDDMKNPDGIYSPKYGPGLQDIDAFGDRYRCKCGYKTKRLNHGLICPLCGTPVEFRGDNFSTFGYICLKDPYHIIHPNMLMSIAFFIGEKTFMNIITPQNRKDEDGHEIEIKKPKDEPFYGIGMMDFYNRFDEIMEYYNVKRNKKDYYESIIQDRDKVFTQSIPVYTTHLRPYRLEGGVLHFEGTNALYNMLANLARVINNDKNKMDKKKKPKDQLLFDMQMKYKELYDEIVKILSGKKGSIRQLFGGR